MWGNFKKFLIIVVLPVQSPFVHSRAQLLSFADQAYDQLNLNQHPQLLRTDQESHYNVNHVDRIDVMAHNPYSIAPN